MGTWCKARSETAETPESVTRHVQDGSTRPRQPRDETSQHGNMTSRATRQHDKWSDTATWQVERHGNMTSRATRQHDKSSDTATWLDHMTLRHYEGHYALQRTLHLTKDITAYKGHYALQRTLQLTKDIMPNPVSLDKRFVNRSSTSRLSATGRIV